MADKITQEEIDKAVAAAAKAAEEFGKSTLFTNAGMKPAPVEGLKPAGTPEQVDTDYSAARKAMAKAANGEPLDDAEKAAMKAYMKKSEDSDADDKKKDDAEKAQKALAKAVSDAVAAALAAKAAPTTAPAAAQSPDLAAFMKSMEARDAKQAELIAEMAKGLSLTAAQAKAATDAVASFAKGGNPGPKSGGAGNQGGVHDVNPALAQRVAQSDFDPRSLEKGVVAARINEQIQKGNPAFNRSDLGNFILHGILRPEAGAALKTAYGA